MLPKLSVAEAIVGALAFFSPFPSPQYKSSHLSSSSSVVVGPSFIASRRGNPFNHYDCRFSSLLSCFTERSRMSLLHWAGYRRMEKGDKQQKERWTSRCLWKGPLYRNTAQRSSREESTNITVCLGHRWSSFIIGELYNDCQRIGSSQRIAVRDMLIEANIQPMKRQTSLVLIRHNKAKTTKRQRRKQKHHEDSAAMLRDAPKSHDLIKQNRKISREVNRQERIAHMKRNLQIEEILRGREGKKILEDERQLARQERQARALTRWQKKVLNDLMCELNDG